MMTRQELIDLLVKNTANIKFTKVDGTVRDMRCTLNKVHLPENLDMNEDSNRKVNESVLPVYDLDKKGWRSFRIDSVIEVDVL